MFSDPVEQLDLPYQRRRHRNRRRTRICRCTGTNVRRIHYAYVFETHYQGMSVRAAQVRVDQPHGNPIVVEVGAARGHRAIGSPSSSWSRS